MRSDGLLKHLALCLLIAVVFYVAAFAWIQHRRTAKGPWEVSFRTDAAGTPSLLILQTNLNVSQTLRFPGRALAPANLCRTIGFALAAGGAALRRIDFPGPDLPAGDSDPAPL